MPFIEFMVYGRPVTADEKEQLFRGCTEVAGKTLNSMPSQVRVAIHEWPEDNYFEGADADDGGAAPEERAR